MTFSWLEEGTVWRVEWRCATRDSGGQCAMTSGISEMQWLSADNLVSLQNVRHTSVTAWACVIVACLPRVLQSEE